jgi:hypothetical protein
MDADYVSARNHLPPVSRLLSVPFRTGPLPLVGLDCVCWAVIREIE